MKILHILETARAEAGGPVENAKNLGILWNRNGHVHDMVTLDPAEPMTLANYPGKITALGSPRGKTLRGMYRYSPDFVPWLRQHARDYDAVIVSGLWRYQTRGALRALRDLGVPYFVFTHGMLDPWFRRRYPLKHAIKQLSWWLAEGPLLRGATHVMFTCEEEGVQADKAFWPYQVKGMTVGYGTSDIVGEAEEQKAAFRALMPKLGDRPFLLFLSRIHEKKGGDLLVEAFATIAAQRPELDLVIAGPDQVGLVAQLQAQADRLGIGSRVHFPGMLRGDVKYGAFRSADAFILPSHQENFGIVVAEALACGTPVLISDKVNIWREISADGAGLVEPDTLEGTKALVARYMALSKEDLDAMRVKARHCFEARFQIENIAKDFMALIEQCVKGAGTA